jgi:hypothetical protein
MGNHEKASKKRVSIVAVNKITGDDCHMVTERYFDKAPNCGR